MSADSLSYFELMAPLTFVFGAIVLLGPTLPLSRSWARSLVFGVVWLIIARYLGWRLFETVIPADGEWYETSWVWFCFTVEMLALFDALILYLMFLRTSDRSAEADVHEARLRSLPSEELPSVDVFIATYNEFIEVLEKTITGARCIDYPNFKIWVLDDGRRPWLLDLCKSKGVGYLTRPNNSHAKAGNINHALTKTNSEFLQSLTRISFRSGIFSFAPWDSSLILELGSCKCRTHSIIMIQRNPAWRCKRLCLTISVSSLRLSCEAAMVGMQPFVVVQIP